MPLLQGRYGYDGQEPVADCAELVTRELLNALHWCPVAQSFDASRLPATASPALRAFYAPSGAAATGRAAEEWMAIVSDLPGVDYLAPLAPSCKKLLQ